MAGSRGARGPGGLKRVAGAGRGPGAFVPGLTVAQPPGMGATQTRGCGAGGCCGHRRSLGVQDVLLAPPRLGTAGPGHPKPPSQGAAPGDLAPHETGGCLGLASSALPAEPHLPAAPTRMMLGTGAARGVLSARGRRSGSRKCLHGDRRSSGPAGAVMEKYERIRVVGRGAFG